MISKSPSWAKAEIALAMEARAAGRSLAEAAAAVNVRFGTGRTAAALCTILTRARRQEEGKAASMVRTAAALAVGARRRAEREARCTPRKCLGRCGQMFPSEGIHNRVCDPCKSTAVWS